MKSQKEIMLSSVKNYLVKFSNKNFKEILEAMDVVDRKNFILDGEENLAYFDNALPIAGGQTISQPSTVGRMLQILELNHGDSVLEIGSGSGWNAALISYLVSPGKIISFERILELAEFARRNIERGALTDNIEIINGDFLKDLKEKKFDKIIFAAGVRQEDELIIDKFAENHLKDKGILVCPRISGPLIIIRKNDGKIEKGYTEEKYQFVPLILKSDDS